MCGRLHPDGEIFVIIQIEDTKGISNLSDMLENVPGIGAVLIGEGDLGQELGFPRQYDHPELLSAMALLSISARGMGLSWGTRMQMPGICKS